MGVGEKERRREERVELLAGCGEERMFTLCSPWAEIAARHCLKRVGEKKKGNWR
jgi:hypothetical protein